jgi:hypothetical protein
MAIYDNLQIPEGVKTYLRMTSVGLGLMGGAIHQAQKLGQNQVWGMDADAVKYALFGIGASAILSTFALATKTRERMNSTSIDNHVQDDVDNDHRNAA